MSALAAVFDKRRFDFAVRRRPVIQSKVKMFSKRKPAYLLYFSLPAVLLAAGIVLVSCVPSTKETVPPDTAVSTGKVLTSGGDLGWSAGQDVTNEFAAVVRRLRPGDTLVLEDMFRVRGSGIRLPDDVTLAGVEGGGLEVMDAGTNKDPLLFLGERNTFDGVTISSVASTPNTGYSGNDAKSGVDYAPGAIIAGFGTNGLTIRSSVFEGNVAMHFDLRFVSNVTVQDTVFDGGYYQMRWLGDGTNYTVERSVFQNSLGDGIKTGRTDGGGIKNVRIADSYFIHNERDGIDTTGGLQNSVISNTVFVGGGMDIKVIMEKPEDIRSAPLNSNITITGSQFIDTKNGIVTTMLDRAGLMTLANVEELMPNNIRVTDTIFEMTNRDQGSQRAFYIKDGHNITWDNVQLLGGVQELRLDNAEAPEGWTAHSIGGTNVRRGPARPASSHTWQKHWRNAR